MNEVKIQFKALIFKNCILLSLFVFLVFPALKAQSLADASYTENLYSNTKVLYKAGDFDNAIKYLNEILLLKNNIPNDINPKYFKVYNRLGLVYREQGDLQKAIEYYRYALENTTDAYDKTLINDNIANIYTETGDYTKAINYLENSLAVLEKSDKERKYIDIISNYHNQGYAYLNSGQMKLALEKCLKSIQIAKENQISVQGIRYNNCALIYQNLDSIDKANFYFKKAVESYEKEYGKEHYNTALAYMYYGASFSELGNYEAGLQLLKNSLKNFLNKFGYKHFYASQCLMRTGNLYYQTKNYKLALSYYQKSLVSKINNFNDSSIYANPGTNVFPDLDLIDVLKAKARALGMLATRENKESNLKAALSTLELTVGFIEQLRMGYLYENSKLVMAEKEYETYMSIIKIAYELLNITGNSDYINVAFKYSERSKYAILRESINEESARNMASIPENIQKQEEEIKEQIGLIRLQIVNENKLENPDSLKQIKLKEKLFSLTQSREKIIGEFEQNYPKYYKRKYENKVVEIGELQSKLLDKEAVISYELTDSTLYSFVITKDSFNLLYNPVDSTFYKNLRSYSDFLHSEYLMNYNSFRIPSYELFQKLIEPTLSYIKGKNLLIIPNSELSLISFESLTTEAYIEKEYADYSTEPYLIRQYPVGYSYSATLFANSKHREKKWNPKFLGFAPDYKNSRDSLDAMPLAIKNIKSISRFIWGKVFTGEDATEYKLKRDYKDYGILHLYAHGDENLDNPQFSKIFLSYRNDTIEDGYLYSYEIDELDIEADLVVLASCYSGSGAVNKGEGVLSIGRNFMNSGTPTIITSLWLAYYEPSLFELKTFYWHLVLGKRKDEALRLAKLKYLDSAKELQSHPKYWNSLVVIGNQDPMFKGYFIQILLLPIILFFILILVLLKVRKSRYKKTIKKQE